MPSGYTESISKGISFKEYALKCAEAFVVEMRDAPLGQGLPEEIKAWSYYGEKLVQTRKELEDLELLSPQECFERAMVYYNQERDSATKGIEKQNDLRAKYEKMLIEVNNYTPPSPLHINYKDFMRSQIEESILFDCGSTYYEEKLNSLVPQTGEEWLEEEKERVSRNIEYYEKEGKEESERAAARNEWLQQLKQSLN